MIKVYFEVEKYIKEYLLSNYKKEINKKFDKNNYLIECYNKEKRLIAIKPEDDVLFVNGDVILVDELVRNIIDLGLNFNITIINKSIEKEFISLIKKELSGEFEIYEYDGDYSLLKYKYGNIKTCVLAGGCFWCMAKPYYEYEGIKKVYSGYSGGTEIFPNYEDVKMQKTKHKECVKLIYDESKITFKEILDIYFETIDPFDEFGQFIDRGESYTTAIYYKAEEERKIADLYIKEVEKRFNKKVTVKILEEDIFYMAEEYHQDYAIKNPEEMEKELIESGRQKNS